MLQTFTRRALVAGAALSIVAGCSGNSLNSGQPSSVVPNSARVVNGMRVLLGPAVAGPRLVPLISRDSNAPAGWPEKKKKKKSLLFVADGSNGVLIYNPATPNGSPTGSITTGVDLPAGVAVDKSGALYVADEGNSTVTVYPHGQSSPSLTISTGISSPYGIGVDSKGNVFVSNLGTNDITAYAAGSTTPYATISFNSEGQAVGVGVDGKDNVWVACDSSNAVYEIPAGTTTPQNANLGGLVGPIGVSFGKSDAVYVSNFSGNNVKIYAYGSTTASTTITDGLSGPTLNGLTSKGLFFQTNQDDDVVGYKSGQTSPFSTLSGASEALGIASSPLIKK